MFFGNLRGRVDVGLSIVLIGCTATTSIVFAQKDKVKEKAIKNFQKKIRGLLQTKISEKDIEKIVSNATNIALAQSTEDETINNLEMEIKKTLLQKKIDERTIKKIISSATRIAFPPTKWEKAVKSLKVEIKKGLRRYQVRTKKTSKMSKEEIDRMSTEDARNIISGIKDEEILKRIISDKIYCLDLLDMAIFDVKKSKKDLFIDSTKSHIKTETGLNILIEDRLKLREILIDKVQNHTASIELLSNINRKTIEKFMNEFIWSFPDDFCGEFIKDEGILDEIADTFIKKYDAELIAKDKKDKLDSEKFDVMLCKAWDALTSQIKISEGNAPKNDNKKNIYSENSVPNDVNEVAKLESKKQEVKIGEKSAVITSEVRAPRSNNKDVYFDTL